MLKHLFSFLESDQQDRIPKTAKPSASTAKASPSSPSEFCGLYLDDSEDDLVAALETTQDAFPEALSSPESPAVPTADARAEFLRIAL